MMVALLVELLKLQRQRVIVVSTPQNTAANGRDECVKSLLKFSPCFGRGATNLAATSPAEQEALLRAFEPKLRKKDFLSFRQFHSQYRGRDLGETCVIVDESHELFNEKSLRPDVRKEIVRLLTTAHRLFSLSGTPWQNAAQMSTQLALVRGHGGDGGGGGGFGGPGDGPDVDELRRLPPGSPDFKELLRRFASAPSSCSLAPKSFLAGSHELLFPVVLRQRASSQVRMSSFFL